jgi:uncharacterized MAPEG superfamily protein
MTTDLWMVVWTVVLASLLPMVYLVGRVQAPGGMAWALGNRDSPLEVAPWAGRAERAHRNLLESLGAFAALVLIAHVSGHANAMTALGATIFFWGRIAHAAIYVAGIPGLRTAAFFVAVFGELLILLQLF